MPKWITGENGELNEIQNPNENLENLIVSQMKDFMVESLIQVNQRGENYSLSILYSDYYSKELMERFAECYNLTLSQMISAHKKS
jgi:hypothetical protein